MNTYKIEEIEEFSTFSKDLYLDKKFILLPNHIPLDAKLKEKLLEYSFINIYSEGEIEKLEIQSKNEDAKDVASSEDVAKEDDSQEEKNEEAIGAKTQLENTCIVFLSFISSVYSTYAARQELEVEPIFEKAKELYSFVKENKNKIIDIPKDTLKGIEPDVILHVWRTTVFVIIIAIQVKMPENRIIEIIVASMLHKIGFLRIPPQLYTEHRQLTARELKTFKSHPIVAYRVLKEKGFPVTVCAGVLEHHEREDGSGYPRGLKGDDISIFGKILAVACAFEASTGDFKGNYGVSSVLEVVRNSEKKYSDVILKSLLFSISVFPIGTFVQLSDKRIGQVVDINPDDINYPVVLIYGGMSAKGEVQIANTSPDGLTIRKPLTKAEIDKVKRTRTAPPR